MRSSERAHEHEFVLFQPVDDFDGVVGDAEQHGARFGDAPFFWQTCGEGRVIRLRIGSPLPAEEASPRAGKRTGLGRGSLSVKRR